MKLALLRLVIMAMTTAFFSTVCEQTVAAQPRMTAQAKRVSDEQISPKLPNLLTGVDGVRGCGEQAHGEVSHASVECGRRKGEADNGDGLAAGDMPRSFVVLARGPGCEEGECTSNHVRRASQEKSRGSAEAESLDDRWEEVLEAIGTEVQILHEAE